MLSDTCAADALAITSRFPSASLSIVACLNGSELNRTATRSSATANFAPRAAAQDCDAMRQEQTTAPQPTESAGRQQRAPAYAYPHCSVPTHSTQQSNPEIATNVTHVQAPFKEQSYCVQKRGSHTNTHTKVLRIMEQGRWMPRSCETDIGMSGNFLQVCRYSYTRTYADSCWWHCFIFHTTQTCRLATAPDNLKHR